jgi:hypothetical protein
MAVLAAMLLAAGFLVRDVLVLQEAARVGARVASVTPGAVATRNAVAEAAPELSELRVAILPARRDSGDQVEVVVRSTRSYGPLSHDLVARSVARVEPVVPSVPPATPDWAQSPAERAP